MMSQVRGDQIVVGRRQVLRSAITLSAASVLAPLAVPFIAHAAPRHELPKLPYPENALEPTISATTVGFHYGKHHKAYVDNLNKLLADAPDLADLSLEEVIKVTSNDPARIGIFNNAAQSWNHTFYWNSMRPGGGAPPAPLRQRIEADFGSWTTFVGEFATAAATQFGSGWAWLVVDNGRLKVVKTGNADTPLMQGKPPLLTIDVWEHAYYLDYQNRRPDYIKAWIENLANWEFAQGELDKLG